MKKFKNLSFRREAHAIGQRSVLAMLLGGALLMVPLGEAKADPAADLAKRLSDLQMDTSYVRLRVSQQDPKMTLQVQIKGRRSAGSADFLYQILWPTERKGESVLLHQEGGGAPTGRKFVMPDKLTNLSSGDLGDSLFGTNLAYQDIIENFFGWETQAIVGTEVVDRKECQILESKPGAGQWSAYGSVRSWVDLEKMVPLRVEKYDKSGRLVRRIDTTRVNKNDKGRHIPSTLVVTKAGSKTVTEFEGARDELGVRYSDDAFTVPKMTDFSVPR